MAAISCILIGFILYLIFKFNKIYYKEIIHDYNYQ
jgi:hypothetical protein